MSGPTLHDACAFTYGAVCELSGGQSVAIACVSMNDLERAWNRMTNSRVPLKRDMVQRIRIEKGTK
jgi:hypothetical protein